MCVCIYAWNPPPRKMGQFYWTLGDLHFHLPLGGKNFLHFGERQQGFLYWGDGVPPLLAKNYSSLLPGKVSPVDSAHQRFISPQPIKLNFSVENIFFRVV